MAVPQLTCCSLTRSRRITRSSSWTTWAWPSISTAALWLCACTAPTPPGHKACWDRCVDACHVQPRESRDAFRCTDDVISGRCSSRLPPSSPGSPAPPAVVPSFVSGGRTRCTGSSARWCRWAWPTCWTSAPWPIASSPAAGPAALHCRCTSCRWSCSLTHKSVYFFID